MTAAVATGFSIWTTHFVAMLAYEAGLPIAYDLGLTVASAMIAVVVTGVGLALHVSVAGSRGAWLGGTIVGLGVAAMHYTGMAALRLPGRLEYDLALVATAIFFGVALAVAALKKDGSRSGSASMLQAAGLLTLSICALHFTGRGGVTAVYDPTVLFEETGFSRDVLIISVASATFIILALSLIGALVDRHLTSRAVEEAERLQALADASAEAIVIARDGSIVDANHLFIRMAGQSLAALRSGHLPTIHRKRDIQRRPGASGSRRSRDAIRGNHIPGRRNRYSGGDLHPQHRFQRLGLRHLHHPRHLRAAEIRSQNPVPGPL